MIRTILGDTLVGMIELHTDPAEQNAAIRASLQGTKENVQRQIDNIKELIEKLGILEVPEDAVEELPEAILQAASDNDIDIVLNWLGVDDASLLGPVPPAPGSVPPARINAKCSSRMGRTLLAEAMYYNAQGLMRLLLQLGAHVEPISDFGTTPLQQACSLADKLGDEARILLQWGADTSVTSAEGATLAEMARQSGNPKLAALLDTPLGGRRCEIVGLQSRTDLNGRTGVATRYLPSKQRYAVEVELTGEQVSVKPDNLNRRDRTPKDMAGKIYIYHGKNEEGANMISYSTVVDSQGDEEFLKQYDTRQQRAKGP